MNNPAELAKELHRRVIDGFEARSVDLPAVRYLAPGANVAYDGEQFTTSVQRVYRGQPGAGGEQFAQFNVWAAEFQLVIVRDTPVIDDNGQPPPSALLEESFIENITDVVTLAEVVEEIVQNRTDPWIPWNSARDVGDAAPAGPEGGIVAAVMTLNVELT